MGWQRQSPAGAMFENDANVWWITGGYDGISDRRITFFYNALNDTFTDSQVNLPKDMYRHNLVNVNNTHMALLCGNQETYDSYLFNRLVKVKTRIWQNQN